MLYRSLLSIWVRASLCVQGAALIGLKGAESGRGSCLFSVYLGSSALLQSELAIQSLRTRYVRGIRTSGYLAIAAGTVFCGFGALELYNGIARIGYFLISSWPLFGVAGVFYLCISKRKEQRDSAAPNTCRSRRRKQV